LTAAVVSLISGMAKKSAEQSAAPERGVHAASTSPITRAVKRDESRAPVVARPSSLLDTRVIYCGDNLEQLAKLPDACDSTFRTPPSAIAVAGSFYYHCDWHASHYVKVMLDQIFGENN
jgi:hypothetical protein